MVADFTVEIIRNALLLAVLLVAPILLVTLLTGLITSALQTMTQLHDSSLGFVPRFIAVVVVGLAVLPWGLHLLVEYTTELYRAIPASVSDLPSGREVRLAVGTHAIRGAHFKRESKKLRIPGSFSSLTHEV